MTHEGAARLYWLLALRGNDDRDQCEKIATKLMLQHPLVAG